MSQRSLFADVAPPKHELIDLRCCGVEELLPLEGDLCIADPPWTYREKIGTSAQDHYGGLSIADIISHLSRIRAPRLVLWQCWPILGADWPDTIDRWGRFTTGGSWHKSAPGDGGHYGPGYHWSGCSEPVLIYTKGKAYTDRAVALRNAWFSPPAQHSRKPVEWMAQMIRRWCPPGGRVVDPYAGLGAVAEAVLVAGEGRSYLGAELDPERHAGALALLAQWRQS